MKKLLLAICLFFSCFIGSLSAGPWFSKEKTEKKEKTPDQLLQEALGDSFKKIGPDIQKMEDAIHLGADVNQNHYGASLLNRVGHIEHFSALRDGWEQQVHRSTPRTPSLYAKEETTEGTECLLEHGAWKSINTSEVRSTFYKACNNAASWMRFPADFARIELMLLYGGPNTVISDKQNVFNRYYITEDSYDVARYLLVYKLAAENPKFLEMLQQSTEEVTDESINNVLTDDQRKLATLCLQRGRTPVTYKQWKSSYYGPSGAAKWHGEGSSPAPLTMYTQWQSTRDHATERVSKVYCNASLQAGVTLSFLTWCWQKSPKGSFRSIDLETFVFAIAEKYFTFPAMEQKLGPPLILKTLPYFNLHNHPDTEIACRVRRLMAHTEKQEEHRKDLASLDASTSERESHL